jgi:SAM-dependent methyltransferase
VDESLIAKYPDLERSHFWWEVRRTLVSRLVAQLPVQAPRVLDVGCGSGMTARELANAGASVVGVDIVPQIGLDETERFRYLCGDFLALSPEIGEFDVVIALDTIEHFEDERVVMEAIFRNTRPGGAVIVTVPAYNWLWSSHDDENRHYRRYRRRRLKSSLESAGFMVGRVGYLFGLLVLPKALVALMERIRSQPIRIASTPSGWLNQLASSYFRTETHLALARKGFLPFGSSVIAVGRKPD